jgi:hypothetical protein
MVPNTFKNMEKLSVDVMRMIIQHLDFRSLVAVMNTSPTLYQLIIKAVQTGHLCACGSGCFHRLFYLIKIWHE